MAVFSIVKYCEKPTSVEEAGCYSSDVIKVGSYCEIRFDSNVAIHIERENWSFLWYGESDTQPDLKRVVDLLESGNFEGLWGGRGVLIAVSKRRPVVYLFNDCYGSFPVYLSTASTSDKLIASDTLRSFQAHDIDWVSFYQFLSLGYIFAPYSLFKGVSRLAANNGAKLEIEGGDAKITQFPLENFWSTSDAPRKVNTDDLIDILREEASGFGATQIMMSGGWDSRLLLSVLEQKAPVLYTHGDLKSREIAIVRDIATMCDLSLVEHSFSPDEFDQDLVSSYLQKNESAMFTHWNKAGVYAEKNDLTMTAGTFGEVLGGHYGTLNTLPGKKKYASLLMHMIGAGVILDNVLHLHDKKTVLNYLKMSSYEVFWFVEYHLSTSLRAQNLIEESNLRLGDIFHSYEEQGMVDAQAMFERFYTEHRGGQYINKQLTNSVRGNRFRNIFTNREFLQAISTASFTSRAHNKINKEIIRRLRPELLDFPMAATLTNARRPLLIQEGSRAFRKLLESSPSLASIYRKWSRYGDRSYGWNNFRDIVTNEWVESLSPFLSKELWDHETLRKAVLSDDTSNMYPFFDMISKALTIDYLVSE